MNLNLSKAKSRIAKVNSSQRKAELNSSSIKAQAAWWNFRGNHEMVGQSILASVLASFMTDKRLAWNVRTGS